MKTKDGPSQSSKRPVVRRVIESGKQRLKMEKLESNDGITGVSKGNPVFRPAPAQFH
jgi:hypothetical protein